MESTFYSRRRQGIFWLFMLGLPAILWGAWWALQSNSNRVEDWLPQDFEETKQLFEFARTFGGDELMMISWPGCTLDDPRLAQFAAELRLPPHPEGSKPSRSTWQEFSSALFAPQPTLDKPLFRKVITGAEAVAELREELSSQKLAQQRLRGWMVGKDDPEKTCVVAIISYDNYGGVTHRHAALDYVYECADRVDGLSPQHVHVAGTTIEGVAIDRASGDMLMPLNAASYGICFLLMFISFRSLWLGLLVFVNAFFSQLLSMALVYYAGGQMDSVLLVVPSLVYVLSISAGVHLVNYYRDAIDEGGLEGAPARAVRYALAPCSLAAATTALGLWSLLVSQLVPVRNFGFYAAIAVLSATAVLLLMLPWQLEHFPPRRWAKRKPHHSSGRVWEVMASLIRHAHWAVAAAGVLLLVAGAVGIFGVEFGGARVGGIATSARLHDMFSPRARVIRDYAWLEENIGPLIPVEVVLEIPVRGDEHRYDAIVERIRLADHVRQEIEQIDGVNAATSAATYLPALPNSNAPGIRSVINRRVFAAKLKNEENRDRLTQQLRMYVEQPQKELWRISARVNAGEDVDYGKLVQEVHRRLPPLFRQAAANGMPGVQATVTGGIPVVHKAQDQLLRDLIWSFGCAFGLIALAMIVLFSLSGANASSPVVKSNGARPEGVVIAMRNVAAGLLCMIPNVLPAVMVFGTMGLLGVQIEVGTMLTASAALGIAVDDTLHYVTWFRRGVSEGLSRRKAIEFAYKRCGNAMIQTTAICGLGLLVFSFSPFGPIARFGWMMFSMLAAALFGDLVVLPAILVGPMGRMFEPFTTSVANTPPTVEESQTADSAVAQT